MSRRNLITLSILVSFLSYGLYLKKSNDDYFNDSRSFILEELPKVDMGGLQASDLTSSVGSFFHFWATWCGPCEKELPDFIKFINKFDGEIKGNLIAVKDDRVKVKVLLNKFNLNENFNVIFDDDGNIMKYFGSLRVPETFLFDNSEKFLKKYTGPQDWLNNYYFENTLFLTK